MSNDGRSYRQLESECRRALAKWEEKQKPKMGMRSPWGILEVLKYITFD